MARSSSLRGRESWNTSTKRTRIQDIAVPSARARCFSEVRTHSEPYPTHYTQAASRAAMTRAAELYLAQLRYIVDARPATVLWRLGYDPPCDGPLVQELFHGARVVLTRAGSAASAALWMTGSALVCDVEAEGDELTGTAPAIYP